MITSTANDKVKLLRSLDSARARQREGQFLVEGVRLAEEAVDAGIRPRLVLYDEALLETDRGRALLADLERASDWVEAASPRVLESVSAVQHTQGLVLAAPLVRPEPPPPRRRRGALADIVVVLDDLADPGNAGTLLRTARAAGVRRVLVTEGSVDPFGTKVVRAAAGAHFWLRLERGFQWRDAANALAGAGTIVLAEAHAGEPYWGRDWRMPCVLVAGGEAHGASADARRAAAGSVRVPMPGGGDSLNVALAAGIVLFEAVRQRAAAPPA